MADERPVPAYGEYAPDGWEWKPDEGSAAQRDEGSLAAEEQHPGRLSGVPHNLGARGSGSQAAPPAQRDPAVGEQSSSAVNDPHAYRASAPGAQPQAARPRSGDRVVTIVLLVLGACGALYSAMSLYQMPGSFELMAAALQVDGFVLPESVRTLGMVGALLVFAVYALNLVYSLQRLRRGKLTFWVPLAAGAVAFIIVFACSAFAASQMPELTRELADPTAMSRILEYVSHTGTAP